MKLGNKDIVKAYLGNQPLSKVMLGDLEIANFAPSPPLNELTDYVVAANTFSDGNWQYNGVGYSAWTFRDLNGIDRQATLQAIPVGYHIRVTEGNTGNSFTAIVTGISGSATAVYVEYDNHDGATSFTLGNPLKLEWQEQPFEGDTEWEKVLARMTSPSAALQEAVQEYVEAEQAAANDNWALTDEVQAFNVDSEVNALTGWKISTVTKPANAPDFIPYDGMSFDELNQEFLNANINGTILPKYDMWDAFVCWLGQTIPNPINNTRMFSDVGDSTTILPRIDGSIFGLLNSTRNVLPSYTVGQEFLMSGTVTENNVPAIFLFENEFYQGGGTISVELLGNAYWGKRANNSSYFSGIARWGSFGAGIGFDQVAHQAHVRRFADRMLIEKHIAVVQPVLDRYTGLTTVEVFAISRYVAREFENGYWDEIDEVFALGLIEESNALIGLKRNTGVVMGAATTHTSGKGFFSSQGGAGGIDTGYDRNDAGYAVADNDEFLFASYEIPETPPTSDGFLLGQTGAAVRFSGLRINSGGFFPRMSIQGRHTIGDDIGGGAQSGMIIQGINDSILTYLYQRAKYVRQSSFTGYALALTSVTLGCNGGTVSIDNWMKVASFGAYGRSSSTPVQPRLHMDNLLQMQNELEINIHAPNEDWNVQDKTYDWGDRALLADQLEALVFQVDLLSDETTAGRTLNLKDNNGVTINAQTHIDSLVNKGWNIILT